MVLNLDEFKKIITQKYEESVNSKTSASRQIYSPSFPEVSQILKESSYLFYEFEDIQVEEYYDTNNPSLGMYTRDISPLFLSSVINDRSNNNLLSIIDEEVPFYHLKPEGPFELEDEYLSESRDPGINDVHSALQTNSFYQVWLRDVFGHIHNMLLLDIYNKLRWPVVLENQYINATLFPTLATEAFEKSDQSAGESLIEFRNSNAENEEDNSFTEDIEGLDEKIYTKTGNIDYLNSVISQKLSSVYELIDYHPDQTDVLSAWGESMWGSGVFTEEDLNTQLSVYKLQDIKYELLKRKFAGTKTLYNIALSSIDRTGSFVTAIAAAGIAISEDEIFKDKRIIRLLNLPGVTTSYNSVIIDPLTYISQKENAPSINNVSSLYYTSSKGYDAEGFFSNSVTRINLLRSNVKTLDWGGLSGLSAGQSLKLIWDTLDTKVIDTEVEEGYSYTKLDTRKDDGKYTTLDTSKELGDTDNNTYPMSNILDISADRLIFNKNTLQQSLGNDYPYVTYPIAKGNSISVMDNYWFNYIQGSIENKSKVQDEIYYGTQINKYQALYGQRLGRYNFFGISYSEKDYNTIEDVLENSYSLTENAPDPSFAYLWFCTVYYYLDDRSDEARNFNVAEIDKKLITRIAIKPKEVQEKFEGIDEYDLLAKISRGMLPFVYSHLCRNSKDESALLGYKYGIVEGEWKDDLDKLGYTKASFGFCSLDIVPEDIVSTEKDYNWSEIEGLFNTYSDVLSYYPRENTKNVFFLVEKSLDSYRWSSPIKVLPLSKIEESLEKSGLVINDTEEDIAVKMYPDWYELGFYLNPYLNFTAKSASPLRHQEVYTTERGVYKGLDDMLVGPSGSNILSNLTRYRGMDFLCNDTGEKGVCKWAQGLSSIHPARNYLGFYLDRTRISRADRDKYTGELVAIYGDNRYIDAFDPLETGNEDSYLLDGTTAADTGERGVAHVNNRVKTQCLEFKVGTYFDGREYKTSEEWMEEFAPNYLSVVPCKEATSSEYEKWWWNRESDGITLCLNISLGSTKTSTLYNNGEFIAPPVSLKDFKKVTLLHREKEFNLTLDYISETSYKITFTYGENSLESKEYDLSKESFRIAASAKKGGKGLTLSMVIGEDLYTSFIENATVVEKENNFNPILIGCSLITEKIGDKEYTHQTNCLIGSIFDLRLFNIGYDLFNLLFISQGSFREIYSYSPSNYVMGYNCCIDLGVFKEINERKVETSNDLEEVSFIRIFNRSVWDSILLDRCPTLRSESDNSSPYYREDFRDPKGDTDIYGWSYGEKTLSDCVELSLESIEKSNSGFQIGESGEDVYLNYYGRSIPVGTGDGTSMVTTLIYPVNYKESSIIDNIKASFEINNDVITNKGGNYLPLPKVIKPSDGQISYEGDFNLSFSIPKTSNFTNYLSKGTNINLQYNNLLQQAVITKTSSGSNSSRNNHVLFPLTVPRQADLTKEYIGYFDRFKLSGLELNSNINTLLIAANYYNELRIPVAMSVVSGEEDNKTRGVVYASKWDAIRTFKEGTYYITCKYPFQILPFADYLYDSNGVDKYNYLYATVRFKIEVSGEPLVYNTGDEKVADIRTTRKNAYFAQNIKSTLLSNGALISPEDNRTFPHRRINIDLFVQDIDENDVAGKMSYDSSSGSAKESYDFTWKLLGTNHPDDYPGEEEGVKWIYLTKQALEDSLVISNVEIPMFFSKNYTSPFFIAKSEKTTNGTKVNSASADDDLIEPIKINPSYSTSKVVSYIRTSGIALYDTTYYSPKSDGSGGYEVATPQPDYEKNESVDNYYIRVENQDSLEVEEEEDLDKILLVAGRSYKILWDYTGYVSEVSFVDKVYSQETLASLELSTKKKNSSALSYTMTDSEKTNYARLSSLMDTSNRSDYMYTEDGLSYRGNDVGVLGRTSGYGIYNKEYIKCKIEDWTGESLPIGDELLDGSLNYENAKKSYFEYSIKEVSSVPSASNMEHGVLYQIEPGGGEYLYYYKNEESSSGYTYFSKKDIQTLDLTTWGGWKFNNFYQNGASENIFRAVVILDDIAFKQNKTYKVWRLFRYVTVGTILDDKYTSISKCPLIGKEDTLYSTTANISKEAFILLDSDAPHFTDVSVLDNSGEYDSSPFYFGNPYSRSSVNNYLLGIRQVASTYSRSNITNSYSFPYVPEDIPDDQYLSGQYITESLDTIKSSYGDTTPIIFNEGDVLKAQYNSLANSLTNAINQLISGNNGSSVSGSSGVFTSISKIEPNYNYIGSEGKSVVDKTYTRATTDTLYGYYSSARNYPSKNENILITRRGLYSNNLITNQDFDNASKWKWGDAGTVLNSGTGSFGNIYSKSYVSDSDWDNGSGKDVCEVSYLGIRPSDNSTDNSKNPLTMSYLAGVTRVGAVYEVALNIKVLDQEYTSTDGWKNYDTTLWMWRENGNGKYVLTNITNCVLECDESITDVSELGTVQENKIILNRHRLLAWGGGINNDGLNVWIPLTLDKYPTTSTTKAKATNEELNTLYIKSRANDITVKVNFMSQGKPVGDTLYIGLSGLSQSSAVKGLAAFDDVWYTLSGEPDKIVVADSIAYSFLCTSPVKFRITKAVVRKSDSKTHALGLSDGLYTKRTSGSNAYVYATSHRSVVYKNSVTGEMTPVQFNPIIETRAGSSSYAAQKVKYVKSGLLNVSDFINENSLGFLAENKKLERLRNPWVRRLHFERKMFSNIEEVYFKAEDGSIYETMGYDSNTTPRTPTFKDSITPVEGNYYYFLNGSNTQKFVYNEGEGDKYILDTVENGNYYIYKNGIFALLETVPFKETSSFYKYNIVVDEYGKKSLKESTSPCVDILRNGSISYKREEDEERGWLKVNSIEVNRSSSSFLKKYDTNLEITNEYIYRTAASSTIIADGPIFVSDATISALINCFSPEKYRNNDSNEIAITNIQLLGKETSSTGDVKKVLWEFEYPPFIYDEKEYHSSYNILMHLPGNGSIEG